MTEYGVIPTGFNLKPLPVILAEIQASLITEFGPDVIQTPQSPMGQLNGLMANIIALVWELGLDIYQSYDPDQAEGIRLDILGKIRLMVRSEDDTDSTYRQAITNAGTARVSTADLIRAVRNVTDVRYTRVFVNDTDETDENQMPRNTVAVAVLGGDEQAIAAQMNAFIIPGISTHGNVPISTVDEDGLCRSLRIVRPVEVPVTLTVTAVFRNDKNGCPPPSPTAVENALLAYLRAADTRPANGTNVSSYLVRQFIESNFPSVEFLLLTGTRYGETVTEGDGVNIEFMEIADVQEVEVLPPLTTGGE